MTRTAKAILRVIALFLVFILGFLSCIGAIVGVGFYIYSSVSLDTVKGFGAEINTDEFFDPDAEVSLSAMTIQKLIEEAQYLMSLGSEADLDMLIERYGLRLPDGMGKFVPDGIRNIPLAELFSANGITAILESTEVDFILEFIPDGIISVQAKEALSGKTLDAVVELRLGYLLEGVKLGYLTGVAYETKEDGSYEVVPTDPDRPTTLELLAPLDLGALLESISGESGEDIYAVVKDTVGDVMLDSLVSSLTNDFSNSLLSGILGDATISDMIVYDEESGEHFFDMLAVLDNRTVGDVLNYYYDENADKWYESEGGEPVDTLFAAVCGVLCSDLLDPSADPVTGESRTQIDIILDATGDLQLGHLMGYEFGYVDELGAEEWYKHSDAGYTYPSNSEKAFLNIKMEAVLGENPIDDAFGTLYVGELMGYERVANPDYDSSDAESKEFIWVDDNGDEAGALYATLADYTVTSLMNGGLSTDDLMNDLALCDVLELEQLYGFDLYINGMPADHSLLEKEIAVWVDNAGNRVNNMMNALAHLSVSGIENEINTLTLGDICGLVKYNGAWHSWDYLPLENRVELVLDTSLATDLAHITFGQFSNNNFEDEIQNIKVGRFIGYTLGIDGEWYDGETLVEGGIISAFTDLTLNDLSDDSKVQTAIQDIDVYEVLGFKKDSVTGVWKDKDGNELSGVMREIAECKVGELNKTINGMQIGKIAGYTFNEQSEKWEDGEGNAASGILGALADLKIEDVTNEDTLSERIQTVTVADVLGYDDSSGVWKDKGGNAVKGVMAVIAGSLVGNIQDTLDDAYMGHILGYEEGAGGTWTKNGVAVDGLMNAVANTKFEELGALYSRLTIADIIPENQRNTGFLSLIAPQTTLENIGTEINDVFNDSTIGELVDKKIIEIDDETCDNLDTLIGTEWRTKPLPKSIQFIVDELIKKIYSTPQS